MASNLSHPLDELSVLETQSIANALRSGNLRHGITETSLERIIPKASKLAQREILRLHSEDKWTPEQIAYLLESLVSARSAQDKRSHIFDLVLSGPKSDAVDTRDTYAVYRELIDTAESEVLLASYAIYNGKGIFEPLVEKQELNPDFKVSIYLDIPRKYNDTSLTCQIVAKYKQEFQKNEWPGKTLPDVYYYKESLNENWKKRASMHAKVVIVDRKRVLVTSANLTNAAQLKNIEMGVILEDPHTAERLTNYFTSLAANGDFKQI